MIESYANEYIYSKDKQFLPEKIEISDQKFQNDIFSYFNKNNILNVNDSYHNFKPVIASKISVNQIDPFNLKVNVTLINNNRDWYIPRFEEKSIYSEKKIIIIEKNDKFRLIYPEWWPRRERSKNSPIVYILKKDNISLLAKFNKGDTYKIEYIIKIPTIDESQSEFSIHFLDGKIPIEIFNRYRKINNNILPNLVTKSNIVQVICKRLSDHKEDGYTCEFRE
ncbi:hypothetical protein AOY20_09440 [Acinetobacter equi]|uniref:Uncharacterized protein n=2 Tax=Acinetobacter equi TaxID=1324350 RepID=A0A0N9VQS6_9GAMM|nr:hypothetical protein AOY20_09440 [Acinetobacter equi]